MSSLIEFHFKKALAYLGFGDCEKVYWSLGYCQGDGMAFEARIEGDGLKKIIREQFFANQSRYLEKYVDMGLAYNLTHFGHYSHWNSMSCEVDWDSLRSIEGEIKEHLYPKLEERAIELRDVIDLYVKQVSKDLEADGYALIEATPCQGSPEIVREYRTQKFTVRVSKHHCEDPDPFSGDGDYDWAEVQDLIAGTYTYYNLHVGVFDQEDEEIGEATCYGMIASPKTEGRSFYGELRGLVKEGLAEARGNLPEEDDETETAEAA